MNEWVDILGYDGLYKINRIGDVYSVRQNRLLSPAISNKGYKYIDLTKNGERQRYLIHRLVAICFVPNPNNYPIVLHKDNIKLNTDANNLQWGTYSENNAQAVKDGLNKVPRPDNTKKYRIYNDIDDVICTGIESVRQLVNLNTKSDVHNYIFRQQPLRQGPYQGYQIRPMIKPFKFQDKRSTISS